MARDASALHDLLIRLADVGVAMWDATEPGASAATVSAWLETFASAEELLQPAEWAGLGELRELTAEVRGLAAVDGAFAGTAATALAGRYGDWVELLRVQAPSLCGATPVELNALEAIDDVSALLIAAQSAVPGDGAVDRGLLQLQGIAGAMAASGHDGLAQTLSELAADVEVVRRSPVAFDGIVAESFADRYEAIMPDLLNAATATAGAATVGEEPAAGGSGLGEAQRLADQAVMALMMLEEGDRGEALAEPLAIVDALHAAVLSSAPPELGTLVLGLKAHLVIVAATRGGLCQSEVEAVQAVLLQVQDGLRAAGREEAVVVDGGALFAALDAAVPAETEGASAQAQQHATSTAEPSVLRLVRTTENPKLLHAFIEDVTDQFETLEGKTLLWEAAPTDEDLLQSIFRSVHTIKGDAGLIGFQHINAVFHALENILSQLREGQIPFRPAYSQLVLECTDLMRTVVSDVQTAMALPSLEAWVPDTQDAELTAMLAKVERVAASGGEAASAAADDGVEDARLGEILVEQGAVSVEQVHAALSEQERPLGEILVERNSTTDEQVDRALTAQRSRRHAIPMSETIKVNLERLDTLIDLVGELSIAETMLATQRKTLSGINGETQEFDKLLDRLGKLTADIQDRAMAMRMVPVKQAFGRFHRLVRDLGRQCGKDIVLDTVGEDTEIDKTVVEQLGDALMHLVRNAVDHGIESPEERAAAGKSNTGHIRLEAYHAAGNVVIEITDDGRGINVDAVRAKAEAKGLVEAGAQLSETQTYNLLFLPGFSTAERVTDVSGRGVGMDVVRRAIDKLRGRVDVESRVGVGSTFRVRLPLTLAIIDGMVVQVGPEQYIIPLVNIVQNLRPTPEQLQTIHGRGEFINAREELLPLVRLHTLYGVEPRHTNPAEALVVVVTSDTQHAALLVDDLVEQQQVVVKALGATFGHLRGISGASIMGDGRVGLILDVPTLLDAI